MRNILLIAITTLIAVSTGLSLEPMKVGFVYTAGTPTSVQVQLADNTSSNLFQGENYTTGITPNSSGVIVVNVRDHAGSGTTWANYQASSVNTYSTLDIYVNGTLYAQYRLDALIISQAQNGILDQDGNLTPPENGSGNVGTDELRWSSAYFDENTVHIGPAEGEANDTEMRLSYDHGTHTGTITIDDEDIITATDEAITIDGITVGQGAGNIASNTAIGSGALRVNTTGVNNTANGRRTLYSNTTGFNNTANGREALYSNTTGFNNTANGVSALLANTEGNNNTATGIDALINNTTGSENTATGRGALARNTIGNNNTANGHRALYFNTVGNNNTANGINSLFNNTIGTYNTATGEGSLYFNTAGNNNTAIGRGASFINSTGSFNTAAGDEALRNNATGSYNLSLGVRSGYTVTSGSNNVFLGYRAGENASQKVDAQNSIALGVNTFTTADNQVVIGDANIEETQLNGIIRNGITEAFGIGELNAARTSIIDYIGPNIISSTSLPNVGNGSIIYIVNAGNGPTFQVLGLTVPDLHMITLVKTGTIWIPSI